MYWNHSEMKCRVIAKKNDFCWYGRDTRDLRLIDVATAAVLSVFLMLSVIVMPGNGWAQDSSSNTMFVASRASTDDNTQTKEEEIEQLRLQEIEIERRNKAILKAKAQIKTGTFLKWCALPVFVGGCIASANVEEDVKVDPVTGEEEHEEWREGLLLLVGSIVGACVVLGIGQHYVNKGEHGLAVAYNPLEGSGQFRLAYNMKF